MKQAILMLAMILIAGSVFAKMIRMKDGTSISGKIVSRDDKMVVIEDERGNSHSIPAADLKEDPAAAAEKAAVDQDTDTSAKDEADAKIAAGVKMRNLGYIMIGGGVVLGGVGIGLIAASGGQTYYEYNSKTGESGSMAGGIGAIMTVGGVALIVTGVVFSIIGSNRIKAYSDKNAMQLDPVDLNHKIMADALSLPKASPELIHMDLLSYSF